ncbi:MAG: tetratricopeptide repeat protein [Wenzhouxiangella sp.]|nr:tetratricopeptide repeat protein [Wenzhouxiangella sp.]TVR97536.1 MAG: hypothetical protein EA418_03060 [Wenzhouxiangellaceae bacterium]
MTAPPPPPLQRIFFDDCVLDPDARELHRGGLLVEVEPRVFDLLCLLAQRPEHSFSKDEIAEALWPGRVISDTVISQAIRKARQACGDSADQQRVIKTLHGIGYRFNAATWHDDAGGERPTLRGSRQGFSRPVRYALWAVTGLLVAALLSWRPWQVPSAELPQRITIAALPAVESGLVGDSLSAGLEVLLSRMAAERSDIQLITSGRTERALDGLGLDPRGDNAVLLEALRQTLGVDYLIRSVVAQDESGYRLQAELTGPEGLTRLIQPKVGDLASMVRGFASELARELGASFREQEGIPVFSNDDFVNEAYVRALNALLAGDNRAATALFTSVLELDPGLVYARYELGNAHWQLGEHEHAAEHYKVSLEMALELETPRLAGHASTMLGVLAWQGGSLDEAQAWYERALTYYEAANDDHAAASALGNLGNLADQRGDLEQAAALQLAAQDRFKAAGDLVGKSATLTNLAVISRQRSRLHEAQRYQQQAVEMQHRLGVGSMLVRSWTYLAGIEIELGNWDEASQLLAEATAMATAQDNRLGMAEAQLEQARLALARLQTSTAETIAKDALSGFEELGMPGGEALALAILAEVELVRGYPEQSFLQLEQADRLDQNISKPRDRAVRQLLRARALEAFEQPPDARSILNDLTGSTDQLIIALSQAGLGSLAWSPDEPEAGLAHWRAALEALERLDEPGQRARLRIRLAEAYLDRLEIEPVIGYLRLAAAWNPTCPQLWLQQARLAILQGRRDEAADILAELLNITELPDQSPFRRQLSGLHDSLHFGATDAAIE